MTTSLNRSDLRQLVSSNFQSQTRAKLCGRVVEARGTLIRVAGIEAHIGELCELRLLDGTVHMAEVTGLANECALLMPHGTLEGLSLGARVTALGHGHLVPVGDALLGRVLNGFGKPIDDLGELQDCEWRSAENDTPGALKRSGINTVFVTGVRAIDSFITLGKGQRVGVFAPAGVGKSTLAGMLAKAKDVDVCVVALVGERGREVGEFIQHTLTEDGMKRTVVIAATSDSSASERYKAAFVATTIAESFRDQGKSVLLIVDSLTRFARALREIGLASGEPPTRRGFPPSVFATLPRLLERAGNSEHGSITAIYTVLVEGEDDSDPIAEEVRSILDGHIVLTKAIAQTQQYPAIDILGSLSRLMPQISDPQHLSSARHVRALIDKYKEIQLLLQVGEYQSGSDLLADEAIEKLPEIKRFLSQSAKDETTFESTLTDLNQLVN